MDLIPSRHSPSLRSERRCGKGCCKEWCAYDHIAEEERRTVEGKEDSD